MTRRRAVYLVARREIRERVRNRGFLISTAITLLGVLAIVAIAAVNSDDGPQSVTVAALDRAGAQTLRDVAQEAKALDLEIEASDRSFADLEQARQAILDGDIDGLLANDRVLIGDEAPDALAPILAQAQADAGMRDSLRKAGLGASEIGEALAAGRAEIEVVRDPEAEDGAGGIAFVTTLLMYLAILGAGYTVASGVVEEKTSRVVELILGAVRPSQLLAGKVAGIGLVSLLQFGLIVLFGVGAASLLGSIELPSATADTAFFALVFFLLGYVLYGCAFAVAGAIVSRQEDSQTSTSPLMLLLVGGYLASFPVLDDPESGLAVALTFLPPVAPMIVPIRVAQGAIPAGQLIISIALMVAACALLIWMAGKIYERAVLRMGAPLKIGEVLGLLRR
jgi:ABC-2 type transport system permease protein